MLDRLLKELPHLTNAVARAEFNRNGSYDVTETGAAETLRGGGAPSGPLAEPVRCRGHAEGGGAVRVGVRPGDLEVRLAERE